MDPCEIGFLEISVDPERIGVDDGDGVHPDIHVVAELGLEIGHIAVDGRHDARAGEVHLCLVALGGGLGDDRFGAAALCFEGLGLALRQRQRR